MSQLRSTPEMKARASATQRVVQNDPVVVAKKSESMRRNYEELCRRAAEVWSTRTPEQLAEHSRKIRELAIVRWDQLEEHQKQSERMKRVWAEYTPEQLAEYRENQRAIQTTIQGEVQNREEVKKSVSVGLKKMWVEKTPEQRAEHGLKSIEV
jgi:acyl-CoA reductase-like NAD-dependent aldehyde dehydrogenase